MQPRFWGWSCWLFGFCLLWQTALPCRAADDHAESSTHASGSAGGSGSHGGEAGHGAADHGKPSLPMGFRGDTAIWSLVTFLVFLYVLSKLAWVPLNQALDQREARIRQDIAAAESNRIKSEALLREYESRLVKVQDEVKEILAEARRDAEHTRQDILSAAQREADATRQRALAEIRQAKDVALGELFDFVSTNVLQAAERVLRRQLSGDDHERLVREALAELNLRRN
jgi:F-type H+-transporting ATPase subunit b